MSSQDPPAPSVFRTHLRRVAIYSVACIAALAFALLVCHRMIGWAFPVASGSMEPTIMTGESVFVRYDGSVPERFEIIVYADVGGGASIKRVGGVPGEDFRIDASGDIRIEGETLPLDTPNRPDLIPMFDSDLQSIGDHWTHGSTSIDPWSLAEGSEAGPNEVWEMDGTAVGRGADLGLLRLHGQVDDGRLLPDGSRLAGLYTVHDVAVSFEVFVVEAGGRLRVQLTEQGDVFEATIPVLEGKPEARIDVFRMRAGKTNEYMFVDRGEVPIGIWIEVRMANIDNHVSFQFGDSQMAVRYARNTLHPTAYDLKPISPGERVRIGGEGVVLRIRNIRVERDFHHVPRGKYGVDHALLLGADEIFVLGDASGVSRDSRDNGPVQMKRVLGRAKAVVHPLKSARILR